MEFKNVWKRCGLTEDEWNQLTEGERIIHYNRQNICEHKTSVDEWPDDLKEAYSHDPYFHTAHMIKCERPEKTIDECPCQMCVMKIGIPRG